jgi:transcriptional regulator with XRE-family HTH domain
MASWVGLGASLRSLRERAAFSIEEVSRRTGVPSHQLQSWESEAVPTLDVDTLGTLLEIYSVDLSSLMALVEQSTAPAVIAGVSDPGLRDARLQEALRRLVKDALAADRRS